MFDNIFEQHKKSSIFKRNEIVRLNVARRYGQPVQNVVFRTKERLRVDVLKMPLEVNMMRMLRGHQITDRKSRVRV